MLENVSYLERHISLNGIRNIEVLVAAVGRECGRESFCRGDNRSPGHMAPGPLEVDVVTLDSMCVKFGAPDVIKMAVEGAEYLALQGAERCLAGNPIIFLATHSAGLAAKCSDLLHSAGYVFTVVAEDEFVFSRPQRLRLANPSCPCNLLTLPAAEVIVSQHPTHVEACRLGRLSHSFSVRALRLRQPYF